jgi:p24 family protein gamma-3
VGKIHGNLEKSIEYQTHHRLREATGRVRAEDLRDRVQLWSLLQFVLISVAAIVIVALLRSFFLDRQYRSSTLWN